MSSLPERVAKQIAYQRDLMRDPTTRFVSPDIVTVDHLTDLLAAHEPRPKAATRRAVKDELERLADDGALRRMVAPQDIHAGARLRDWYRIPGRTYWPR